MDSLTIRDGGQSQSRGTCCEMLNSCLSNSSSCLGEAEAERLLRALGALDRPRGSVTLEGSLCPAALRRDAYGMTKARLYRVPQGAQGSLGFISLAG